MRILPNPAMQDSAAATEVITCIKDLKAIFCDNSGAPSRWLGVSYWYVREEFEQVRCVTYP